MFTHFALTVFALTCLQCIEFVNTKKRTTCDRGADCSTCTGNRVATVGGTQVCCPDCSSQYFDYGTDNDGYYCNCNILLVLGNASVGEECSSSGMTTYLWRFAMPVCCPDPYVARDSGLDRKGRYTIDCVLNGDCWRGSQCDVCNSHGSIDMVHVCCANCQSGGLHLGPGDRCNCNN